MRELEIPEIVVARWEARKCLFAELDPLSIEQFYRFRSREDLTRLLAGFQFPHVCRFANGSKLRGETVLLIGIRRLAMAPTQTELAEHFFGSTRKDKTILRALQFFFDHLVRHWSYLLLDNLEYWVDSFPMFANKIRAKMLEKSRGVLDFEEQTLAQPDGFKVCAFIDNTMHAICRPGGGPANDGINAPRNDDLLQRAFYTGWKKIHALKWQTVYLPNGMTGHLWGPASIRHNDLWTLHESDIHNLWVTAQLGRPLQFYIYGDGIYPWLSHLFSRYKAAAGDALDPLEVLENKCFSTCRETVEWEYRDLKILFKLVECKNLLRIRQSNVVDMVLVAFLLKNAYQSMYARGTPEYFDCLPPRFEDWVNARGAIPPVP
jgi:hypothetical protein